MTIEISLTEQIQEIWAALVSGRVSYLSYASLQAAVSRPFGSIAEVSGDAGTHTDPVSALVVNNNGVYRRVDAGWQRMADLPADVLAGAQAAATAAAASQTQAAISAAAAASSAAGLIGQDLVVDAMAGATAAIKAQAGYDQLAAAGGGILRFGRGTYDIALNMTSRNVHLRGAGRGGTLIRPTTAGGVALRALYRTGGWDGVTVEDLALTGIGSLQGVGFQAGADVYGVDDEYTGVTFFSRVKFSNFDKHISRPYGSIGLFADGCQFGSANFHHHSRGIAAAAYSPGGNPNDLMHSGCLFVTRSHMSAAQKAVFFTDSPATDSGQYHFGNNVMELNPGWIMYIKSLESRNGIPGVTWYNNWNEANHTGGAISVDGEAAAVPKYGFIQNCSLPVEFDKTPIGPLTLINSSVLTRDCNAEKLTSASIDASSSLEHERVRKFSGQLPGKTTKIGRSQTGGLNTPWFEVDLPLGLTKAWNAGLLYRVDGSAVIAYTGTVGRSSAASAANDAALPGLTSSQTFLLQSGETEFPTTNYTIPTLKYIVSLRVEKLISGPAVTVGGYPSGFAGSLSISSPRWKYFANISYNAGAAMAAQQQSYSGVAANASIGIGGVAVLAFDTYAEALDCVNSGLFPA